jgi:hypothetical protein
VPDVVTNERKVTHMDGDRFDALARSLATSHPRRTVLRGVFGGAAGGMLSLVGRSGADADLCKPLEKQCKKDVQCCSGHCAPSPSGSISTAHSDSICCAAGKVQYPVGICCTPTTCAAAGATCGTIPDGCGGTLSCGPCTAPQTCGGGGIANVCGCTPTTCAAQGATCGTISNTCGGTLPCGSCDAGACLICTDDHTCASICTGGRVCCGGGACGLADGTPGCAGDADCCSGICVAGICQAAPGSDGSPCDSAADCAGGIPCVDGVCCASGLVCGGTCCTSGGQVCSTETGACCTPTTCEAEGKDCDAISDTCGGTVNCGQCAAPQTCGGGGTPNVCGGCAPTTCGDLGFNCGEIADNCGGTQQCGECGDNEVCFENLCFPLVICQPLGALCDTNNSCCDSECVATALDGQGICGGCRSVGEVCSFDLQCCSGGPRSLFGRCWDSGTCCNKGGEPCSQPSDCCFWDAPGYDITCQADRCCGAPGEACFFDDECCSGNGCCLTDDCNTHTFTGTCR